jgi:serine protease inhibitor
VLANAVYFKAKWEIPFESSNTRPGSFHRLDGSRVDAQFMSQTMYGAQYASCSDGFKAEAALGVCPCIPWNTNDLAQKKIMYI